MPVIWGTVLKDYQKQRLVSFLDPDADPLGSGFQLLQSQIAVSTGGPFGTNTRFTNEEVVITELGQVGTQLDMFSHQEIDGLLYNCIRTADIQTRNGFSKLGVDQIGSLITRGVLIDVAAAKGVDMLPLSYEITVADLQDALAKLHTDISVEFWSPQSGFEFGGRDQ